MDLVCDLAQTLERYHADRLLTIDLETSRTWGELTAVAQKARADLFS